MRTASIFKPIKPTVSRLKPRPGEVQLKVWLQTEAARCGITESGVFQRLKRGKYPEVKVRRVNARVVFVRVS